MKDLRKHFYCKTGVLFRRVVLSLRQAYIKLPANSVPQRYVYPRSEPLVSASSIPYPGLEFSERPWNCPSRSCFAPTPIHGLSRRYTICLRALYPQTPSMLGLKPVSVLIIVQAMTSILAASLTRILVRMPAGSSNSRCTVRGSRCLELKRSAPPDTAHISDHYCRVWRSPAQPSGQPGRP